MHFASSNMQHWALVSPINQQLTQQVVMFGLMLWLLLVLRTELDSLQGKLLPSPLYTAHVRTTVMVLVAGPLLAVFCSLGAVTVALVVKGPAAVGRTTMGRTLLPPAGMLAMVQVTVMGVVPVAVQPAANKVHAVVQELHVV
jgi:hypothetical protein